ncbi:MAG TPA: cyclic peptide export ABC transporter, partial [Thermoanaerobaculia bacterium]|nr:cyclic peptide export ABC transporter [Thermoanaerobaculia bacterium]
MASTRSASPTVLQLLSYLLEHSRKLMALYLLGGAVTGAANIGVLALMTAILSGRGHRLTLLWSFLGLCLLFPLARALSELLLTHVGEGTVMAMRMRLSERVLAVPLRELEEMGPHRILSTLTDDIPAISQALRILPILTLNSAIILAALFYLGWLSLKGFAIMLVLMILGMLSYQIPIIRAFRVMQRARELNDTLYQHFRALIEGAKELRLHRLRRETFLDRELLGTAEGVRRQNIDGARIFIFATSWGQLLLFVVIGLLLFGLPLLTRTDAAMLTGYTLTLLYLMTPLQTVMDSLPTLNRAKVALARIERMGFELAKAGDEAASPAPFRTPWHRLDLVGVTHVFQREDHEGEFVLGPLDLTLKPGELVFIAGGNGSGKTTLGKILTGLYLPDQGEIRLDGQPVTGENRDAYRQLFSAIFFDFFLFQTLLGLEGPDVDAKAAELLAQLQLTGKVRVEGGRLSSTDLSQGQRKRLALLTAYLEDRPIYLFDEWAADQDPRFKEIFYHQLLP